jgi:hypothetical protein
MTWLLNLGFAGGEAEAEWSLETLHVPFEKRTWYVHRGTFDDMNLYLNEGNTKRVVIDWSRWLTSGVSVSSVAWESDPEGYVTIANTSNNSTSATAYITADSDILDIGLDVKATMITDAAIPEIDSRSIQVKILRTY